MHVEYAPAADTWFNSCPTGWNGKYGCPTDDEHSEELALRAWDYGPRVFRSALRFDLSTLAPGVRIASATMRIHWYAGHWATPTIQKTVDVHAVTTPWVEGNSNWRYRDDPVEWDSVESWDHWTPYFSGPAGAAGGGGDYSSVVVASDVLEWVADGSEAAWLSFPGEWLEFDVTEQVQAWVGGEEAYGLLLKLRSEPDGGGSTVYQFYSKDCTMEGVGCFENEKPYLEVTFYDCNANSIPDECEIECGSTGGMCDVPGCGENPDCNANRIPDDCEQIDGPDFGGSGGVGLTDYRGFAECMGGPEGPPVPPLAACDSMCLGAFDGDYDGDVDLRDFVAFETALGAGPAECEWTLIAPCR